MTKITREYLQQLDEKDGLAKFRNEFYLNDQVIYLNGNSLGLLSRRAEASLNEVMEMWKQYGIDGWMKGKRPWFYFTDELSELMAPLVGAAPEEVCVTGSTTTNIHQMIATLYQPTKERYKILADELNFPSDIYALKSQLALKGYHEDALVQVQSRDGQTLLTDDIIAQMTDDIALILLPSVLYRSGQVLDMKTLTEEAHRRGIVIGFDLCHSIGSLPHELNAWDVDFAVWCTYKHLNGGPGSIGGLYINEKHHVHAPGLAGWFGSDKNKQFDMEHDFSQAIDAGAYQIGTPHMLSAAPLIGALEMMNEATIDAVRAKSLLMTDLLIELVTEHLVPLGFIITTPLDHHARGGHLYIEHDEAARITKAMKAEGIIPDFRAPKGIRLSPVALYNTFTELYDTVSIIKSIMTEEKYREYKNEREVVA
ncbi:kynureninase [Macrococcus lamae]|nr:kynureninase [Macrococcus lamae]